MPTFEITLDVFVFGLVLIVAVLIGYLPRSRQLMRKNRQIARLEGEMMQAHAELLESQREFCEQEAKLKDITNPVVAMNSISSDDPSQMPLSERDGLRHHRPAGTR